MTGMVLPVALLPLLFGKNDVLPTAQTLLSALAIPVFLAGVSGTATSGNHPWIKDPFCLPPFLATLPIATADIVGAKLKMAALSVLAAWVLVAAVLPLAVIATGNVDEVVEWWRQAVCAAHPLQVIAGMFIAVLLLVVWTWKRKVDSLLIPLMGRPSIIQGSVVVFMVGFAALGIVGSWIYHHPETHRPLLTLVPWFLGIQLLVRLLATGFALRLALGWGLLKPRTVSKWLTGGLLLALGTFGVLAWVVPAEAVSWYYLAVGVLWCLPLAHLAATPLALAWNRHR
jgi:hypothetical protein